MNNILRETSDGRQVLYLDWAEFLDSVGRRDKFIDFIHFSNAGAGDIAGLIAGFIVDQKLLAKR